MLAVNFNWYIYDTAFLKLLGKYIRSKDMNELVEIAMPILVGVDAIHIGLFWNTLFIIFQGLSYDFQ